MSFSGNCYLSSYLCEASGNRGKCKQLCRLPYTFEKDGKKLKSGYLLSAKDFNMIDKLKDLSNAGVDVLKIEGRARRPFYVATASNEYFKALNKQKVNQENLKLAFNRDYTAGYFDGNGNIISNIQNHIGIYIGKVEKVVAGKKFNEIYISSNRELTAKSSFKIFENKKEKTIISAFDLQKVKKGLYRITSTQKLSVGDSVNLMIDAGIENEILNFVKKREIEVKLYLQENCPIKAVVSLHGEDFEIVGDILEKANSKPISIEELKNNFNKSDLFQANLKIEQLDNVFMQKQKLNEFRRQVFAKVYDKLTQPFYHNLSKIKIDNNYKIIKFQDFQIIEKIDEKFEKHNIIYSPECYELEDIKCFVEKCKTTNKQPYLDTPNFALKEDIELLNEIINQTKISIIANNYYALNFQTNIVIGAGLNVYNNQTAKIYNKPIITAESEISTKIDYPYMTLRHCPMKSNMGANCGNCPYSDGYTYKMDNGKILKLKRKKLSTCTFYLTK